MNAARILRNAWCAAALAVLAPLAAAVDWGMSDSTLDALSHDATQSLLIRQVLKDAQGRGRAAAPQRPSAARTTFAAGGSGVTVARRLSAGQPAARRAEIERDFDQLLRGYHAIEDRFGIPRHDVAGALAAFIAGGWMAYRNQDFPDPYFRPLVEQMRGVLAANPAFAKAGAAERRAMYEQLAILGMAMAGAQIALKRQPDGGAESRMRANAKAQLERFLQTDPERLTITRDGLAIR
jgi:hypothetical protein